MVTKEQSITTAIQKLQCNKAQSTDEIKKWTKVTGKVVVQ